MKFKILFLTYILFSASSFGQILSLPTATPNPVCENSTLSLFANPNGGTAPYSFAWTGPAGFTSNFQNPTIASATAANSGVYTLITTDFLGVSSVSESTSAVVVMPKINPTFETLLLFYCRKVTPNVPTILPLLPVILPVQLPNTSTEGVDGAWSLKPINDNPLALPLFVDTDPAPVNQLNVTKRYYFYPNASECGNNTFVDITITRNAIPTFGFPLVYCVGDNVLNLPLNSTNSVGGTWSDVLGNPITKINTSLTGIQQINFTPNPGLCALQVAVFVNVKPKLIPTFNLPNFVCLNGPVPILPSSSTNLPSPIIGTWSPAVISNTNTQTYNFTPTVALGNCSLPYSITINVNPNIVPTFNQIAPVCQGTTAPALPNPSLNAPSITGTWSPAIINTGTIGNTTYSFTPAAGQCAVPTTMTIQITAPNIVPTFNQIAPVCQGTTAPALPNPSSNAPSITGTWSPAIINTGTIGNTTYSFTPAAGQCAVPTTMTVQIIAPNIVPTFNQIAPVCQGSIAPALPNPSTNAPSITGTWSPATINTGTIGNTNYTFTPAAGQCALNTTMTIEITAPIVPIFNQIAPVCQGTIAPALPNPSTNAPSITGTWSPATISTATLGSTIYTFTPATGQCAVPTTMTVQIIAPNIVPTFNQIAPVCQGTIAPALPNPSTNAPSITGTWSPATINTGAIGNTIYTFTPATGQCAVPTTMTIEITAPIVPTFNQIAPVCLGTIAPALPNPSTNAPSITGTWSPTTINTGTLGGAIYTFTPSAGQCAVPTTMTIQITAPNIVPTFNQITPVCQGNNAPILSNISNNLISGTWSPATINTSNAGTTVYTFTPTLGQCSQTQTMTIQIILRDTPTFNAIITSICKKELNTPVLSTTSTNGITGTWSPPIVSSATVGDVTYTFTPDATFCATKPTIKITTYEPTIEPKFDNVSRSICAGGSIPSLPNSSQNGIFGVWSPSIVNPTSTGTYTFTSNAGQCAKDLTITITYVPEIVSEITYECLNANYTLTVNSVGNTFNPNNTYTWIDEAVPSIIIQNGKTTSFNVSAYQESTTKLESFPIIYKVLIKTPEGCLSTQSFKINDIYCGIQKGISPNGDGFNDFYDLSNFDVKQFSIFNRYGVKVYTKTNYTKEWVGQTDSGEILPDATYFYNIEFSNNETKTGWVYINKEIK